MSEESGLIGATMPSILWSQEQVEYRPIDDPGQLVAYIRHRFECQMFRSLWRVDPGCSLCEAWEKAIAEETAGNGKNS